MPEVHYGKVLTAPDDLKSVLWQITIDDALYTLKFLAGLELKNKICIKVMYLQILQLSNKFFFWAWKRYAIMLAYSSFRDLFLSRRQIVFVTSAWSSFETTLPILGGADESIEETGEGYMWFACTWQSFLRGFDCFPYCFGFLSSFIDRFSPF